MSRGYWRPDRDITWNTYVWYLPHTQVVGGTIGLYKTYFLHRMSVYTPSSFSLFPQLPQGNVGIVINEKIESGISSATYESNDVFTGR